jgi:hypothetical protein
MTQLERLVSEKMEWGEKLRKVTNQRDRLLETCREIGQRGPVDGYGSKGAILLRLVGMQSIARAAVTEYEKTEH